MSDVVELHSRNEASRDYFEALFENLPIAAFVIDDEFRCQDFNRQGFKLMNLGSPEIENLLLGEAVDCVNATGPGGCGGTSACNECVLRNCIEETFIGGRGLRAKGVMTLRREPGIVSEKLLISTALIRANSGPSVLVTIQPMVSAE